jgi:hypothetical protein
MLRGIPFHQIDSVWPTVRPLIMRALGKGQGDSLPIDIYRSLVERDMQLWAWSEGDQIDACAVTQIVTYPRRKVCQVHLVAGIGLKKWLAAQEVIASWAKENGCSQLEAFCRDGWRRVLPSWRKAWVAMRRDV